MEQRRALRNQVSRNRSTSGALEDPQATVWGVRWIMGVYDLRDNLVGVRII